jgi:RNA polymerase sigma factor (sigma-70 family)
MESIRFTRQEEAELCRRMRQGDGEAKELLAKSVLSWAVDMAHRLENGQASLSPDVVESAAYMAVARALKTFDPDKGRLTTHVSFYVRASIMDERRIRHVIHIPAYLLESNEKETPLREQLWVQAETALAIYPIDRMLHPRRSWKRGLSKAHDRWEPVDGRPTPGKSCEDADERRHKLECCAFAMSELGKRFPRHVQVLELRNKGMVLDQVGEQLGISRERARQLEAGALRFVRQRAAKLMESPRRKWRRNFQIKIGS